MQSIADVLTNHNLYQKKTISSIESSDNNSTKSIKIPVEVDNLIDDKNYRPKFRKLMQQYPRELLALVEIAHTKTQPSRWFAVATSKKQWEQTLKFLQRLFKVRELAARVAKKLGTTASKFIYKQVWQGINVERWAVTAAETGRHKLKYFSWLCKREMSASGPSAPAQAAGAGR